MSKRTKTFKAKNIMKTYGQNSNGANINHYLKINNYDNHTWLLKSEKIFTPLSLDLFKFCVFGDDWYYTFYILLSVISF
jgi:hypothetical protein